MSNHLREQRELEQARKVAVAAVKGLEDEVLRLRDELGAALVRENNLIAEVEKLKRKR